MLEDGTCRGAEELGNDHPGGTLATRNKIASWTGAAGDPGRALELCARPYSPTISGSWATTTPTNLTTPQQHRSLGGTVEAPQPLTIAVKPLSVR